MRLIDAEILRYRLYKTRNAALADGRNKAYGKGFRDAIEILEAQPTVEPELLEEQEAVEPVFEVKNPNVVGQFHCGNCHHAFCYSHYKFCPECGRKVKW